MYAKSRGCSILSDAAAMDQVMERAQDDFLGDLDWAEVEEAAGEFVEV